MPKTPHSSLNLSMRAGVARGRRSARGRSASRSRQYRSCDVMAACSALAAARARSAAASRPTSAGTRRSARRAIDAPAATIARCGRSARLRADAVDAATATAPDASPPVVPITPRGNVRPGATLHDRARRRTRRTMTRPPASPKSVPSAAIAGSPARGTSTSQPMPPVSNAHSASVTARPPSEQSCADCSRPPAAARRSAARCSARFALRGPAPAARPAPGRGSIFRYSLPPSSPTFVARAARSRRRRRLNVRASDARRILDQPDDADDRRRDRSPGRRSRCRG